MYVDIIMIAFSNWNDNLKRKYFIKFLINTPLNEPPRDKTNKMACAPSEDSDQPGHPPSLNRVFAVRSVGSSAFFMRTAKTLIRLGGCPGWSESSLGAHQFVGFVIMRLTFGSVVILKPLSKSTGVTDGMSRLMRKSVFALFEQQRRRSACASAQSDQHLCCSLHRLYNTSSFYIRNFKPLPSYCGCAGRFESYLVRNRKQVFSWRDSYLSQRNVFLKHYRIAFYPLCTSSIVLATFFSWHYGWGFRSVCLWSQSNKLYFLSVCLSVCLSDYCKKCTDQ